jgi:hypothetical protein
MKIMNRNNALRPQTGDLVPTEEQVIGSGHLPHP